MGGCFSKARQDEINLDEERPEAQEIEETPINVLIKEGKALLNLRKFHEAEQKFAEVLALDNMSIDAWRGKGWVAAGLDQVKEAEKYYERADNLPTFIHAKKLYEAGQVKDFRGPWGGDRVDVEGAEAYYCFGEELELADMHKEAIEFFDIAIALNYHNLDYPYRAKGESLHALGMYNEALECFDISIGLCSSDSNHYIYLSKGKTLHATKRFAEAVECFDQAISTDKYNSPYPYCLKAQSLLALGLDEKALESFQKAELHDPNSYLKNLFDKKEVLLLQKLAEFGSIKIEKLEIDPAHDTVAASSTDAEYQATQIKTDEIKHRQSIIIDQTLAAIALQDDKANRDLFTQIFKALEDAKQEKLQHNEEIKKLRHEVELLKSSKVDRVEISYAITMNFEWKTRESKIEAIKANDKSFKYWDGFRFTFDSAYNASKLALEGTVNIDSSNIIISGIATAASLIPFAGDLVSGTVRTIGEMVQSVLIKQKAARFTQIASDAKDCAEFVMDLAIKITLHSDKAREIDSDDAPAQAISAWGKFLAKFGSLGSNVAKAIEGDRYDTPQAKMGHRDALLLIEQLGDGEIVLKPRDSLIDRCCDALGLAREESGFGFGFDS